MSHPGYGPGGYPPENPQDPQPQPPDPAYPYPAGEPYQQAGGPSYTTDPPVSGQPASPAPPGQPYSPAGQPYPPAGQPYSPAGQPYPPAPQPPAYDPAPPQPSYDPGYPGGPPPQQATMSMPIVSAPPTSGVPMPMSGPPVSGLPISGMPVSGTPERRSLATPMLIGAIVLFVLLSGVMTTLFITTNGTLSSTRRNDAAEIAKRDETIKTTQGDLEKTKKELQDAKDQLGKTQTDLKGSQNQTAEERRQKEVIAKCLTLFTEALTANSRGDTATFQAKVKELGPVCDEADKYLP